MNGMKLGGSNVKNSFGYDNQFLNYSESESDEDSSQEEQDSESVSKNTENIKVPQKVNPQKSLVVDINAKQKQTQKQRENMKIDKKSDIQQKRLQNLNNGMQQLGASIVQMKQKYDTLDIQQVMLKKRNEKKQSEIKSFLTNKQKQKEVMSKRLSKVRQRQKRVLEQTLQMQEQEKQKMINKRKQQENERKIKMRQKRQLEKQKRLEDDKKVSQMYSKIFEQQKVKKKFHIRKAQEDELINQKQKQNYKLLLSQRRQSYRPIDFESIQDHQRQYQQKLGQMLEAKRIKRQDALQKIAEANTKRGKRYKGHSHEFVEEQQQQRRNKKQQPFEKRRKMNNYQQYIKKNFIPKTHQARNNRSLDIQRQSSLTHRKVKRYKYLKGQAYGQVYDNRPIAKSEVQQRKMGNNYLEYLKKLPKKKKFEQQEEFTTQDLQILNNKLNSIVRVKKQRYSLYQKSARKKSLQVKLTEKPNRQQVNIAIQKLKIQDQKNKMNQRILRSGKYNSNDLSNRQKQINSDIIDNIERKLNLLAKI